MEIKVNDKKTYYESLPKKQLITFLINQDYILDLTEKKIAFLTGCPIFGDSDGTNGACIDCFYDNHALFERCEKFQKEYPWEKGRDDYEIMA